MNITEQNIVGIEFQCSDTLYKVHSFDKSKTNPIDLIVLQEGAKPYSWGTLDFFLRCVKDNSFIIKSIPNGIYEIF